MAKKLSRLQAAESGNKHYKGSTCKRDPQHGATRYTSSGQCVQCCLDASKKRVGHIRDTLKAAVTA